MRVVVRSLLAAALVALAASCSLNDHGLGATDASHPGSGAAGHSTGAAGTGAADGTAGASVDPSGAAGATPPLTGAAGDGSMGAAGDGSTGAAGDGSTGAAGDAAVGAAGASPSTDVAGAPGTSGVAGATTGDAGVSAGGTGGGAGSTVTGAAGASAGGAGGTATAGTSGTAPQPGCSDGTREGYIDMKAYPNIAACSGAWDEPGLSSTKARAPQCDRRSGNDGDKADGRGCSVADLCASGWRVCETAHAVSTAAGETGCTSAISEYGTKPVFFVTRQRASGLTCDATNQTGANNLYGCGNIGSTADKASCAPFTHMLRDSDCQANYPWVCADGPYGTSTDEYDIVTKESASRGGVLCCKD